MSQNYYELSMRTLQLAGISERTQECYTRAVRMFVEFRVNVMANGFGISGFVAQRSPGSSLTDEAT